ncbi:MAG: segregation/condensation protein A, partial [Chloroflexota bacterium]|nr:segregation/condensation protein A [Chloroflexota bacterium]
HDPEEDLRRRLVVYRRYRDAGRQLGDWLTAGTVLFRREPAVATAAAQAASLTGVRPVSRPLDAQLLADALSSSAHRVPVPSPPPEMVGRVVTLEERAAIIRGALRRAPRLVLQELLHDVTDRLVVAVTFLALLELAKGRELSIEQAEPWGPIEVRARRQDADGR